MKILITGATGFLGLALCSELESTGHELIRLNSQNCDLTKQNSLSRFNNYTFDQIYHLAAWTQAGDFCLYHAGEQWIINQRINTNILAWWQKYQSQAKLICIGTSCAYEPEGEMIEENYLKGSPIDSLFTYAMTKRMLYAGLLALNKQFGLKYICFVPSTLYGPCYHTDGRQMHFIFDIIRKIIRGKIYDKPVVLWGDGYQSRDLIYVEDFVRIMLKLSDICENELINIGSGEDYTIRHYAKIICEKTGYDVDKIYFDTSSYVGAISKCLVVKKLRCILPDIELASLDEGLAKTIDWFWNHGENLLYRE